jgi:uncharacterized protein
LIVCITALLASGLTLFSGFGLGTILMPAFAIFFPIEIAIAMTAIVHMANNIFKLFLVGRKADKQVLMKFVPPAILAAFAGAWLLTLLTDMPVITSYMIGEREFQVTPVKVVIGLLMIGFAFVELLPRFERMQFDKKYLPIGGLISGFFGGLSGNQGALRSAFLSKVGLDKEAFIATGVITAAIIDFTRLSVYLGHMTNVGLDANWKLVLAATLTAFTGAFIGSRLLKKITLKTVQLIVGIMLMFIGISLGVGLI